jgi:hypothetical protein
MFRGRNLLLATWFRLNLYDVTGMPGCSVVDTKWNDLSHVTLVRIAFLRVAFQTNRFLSLKFLLAASKTSFKGGIWDYDSGVFIRPCGTMRDKTEGHTD